MTTELETPVWLAFKRWNPFQQTYQGVLRLEDDMLSFHGPNGEAFRSALADARCKFPRSMSGMGFELTVQGTKLYVWFSDPFAGRTAMLEGGDQDEANMENAKGFFDGRRAAKPWLRTLRAVTS